LIIEARGNHPVKHLGFPEASIEAATTFRQITGQVLVTDAMIHSTNTAFDVSDQGLVGWQRGQKLAFRDRVFYAARGKIIRRWR
jgi:hypothetical protein